MMKEERDASRFAAAETDDALPPADASRRLEFLRLSEADAEVLRGMLPEFHRWADDFVEAFYRHLLSFDETARFLRSAEKVRWLKRVQRDHFESMLAADWNDDYYQQRRHVGSAHAEIGLQPQFFLGAYNEYVQYSFDRLAEDHANNTGEFKSVVLSLLKAIFFDIGLTLDAYFAQSTRNLRQALDMYWRANVELRQFAQLTSHDLKTPLATVANLCDEALDEFGDQMPDSANKLITAARDRTFRMSRMIDELLATVVSLGDGAGDEHVSIQEALDETLETYGSLLAEKGIDLRIQRPLPTVRGQKPHLREVFNNLLSNAIKFIDRRPGSLNISAIVGNGTCELIIADNGPGIPPEDIDRIFVPFRRLAMHKGRPGSGLGLYFTRNLVMQLGGRIWVKSEPGRGSEFHIELRLAEPRQPAAGGESSERTMS